MATKADLQAEVNRLRSALKEVVQDMKIVQERAETEGVHWTIGYLRSVATSAERGLR